mmetsp:Transcript_105129/g.292792  ORF Transcript_105129/g.292792 Transcript_105129/m.292792 type:complete len:290 (-) Transcript_105129:828-1697(-)
MLTSNISTLSMPRGRCTCSPTRDHTSLAYAFMMASCMLTSWSRSRFCAKRACLSFFGPARTCAKSASTFALVSSTIRDASSHSRSLSPLSSRLRSSLPLVAELGAKASSSTAALPADLPVDVAAPAQASATAKPVGDATAAFARSPVGMATVAVDGSPSVATAAAAAPGGPPSAAAAAVAARATVGMAAATLPPSAAGTSRALRTAPSGGASVATTLAAAAPGASDSAQARGQEGGEGAARHRGIRGGGVLGPVSIAESWPLPFAACTPSWLSPCVGGTCGKTSAAGSS